MPLALPLVLPDVRGHEGGTVGPPDVVRFRLVPARDWRGVYSSFHMRSRTPIPRGQPRTNSRSPRASSHNELLIPTDMGKAITSDTSNQGCKWDHALHCSQLLLVPRRRILWVGLVGRPGLWRPSIVVLAADIATTPLTARVHRASTRMGLASPCLYAFCM